MWVTRPASTGCSRTSTSSSPSPTSACSNASARAPGPITDVDHEQARTALLISSYGGFFVAQAAAQRMLPHGAGTILLTGASASVMGYPPAASMRV
jgi:NAD(P)-dependent dehydrogenase (short-subunit alcohol dehydrogenase family)